MQQARETRARERGGRVEERARNLSLDIADAQELFKRILATQARESSPSRERESRRARDSDSLRLTQLLERMERDARELERELRAGPREEVRQPISDLDFRELVSSVNRKSFALEKVSVMQLAARSSYFTCDQLRQLIRLMSFSDGQEDVAVLIYPRLTDPQRFHTLSDMFTFSSSWNSVCTRLGLR